MDRKIEKKAMPLRRLFPIVGIGAVVFLAYQVVAHSGETRLKVDPN